MECKKCTEESIEACNCPSKDMSTDCSTYTGDDLSCSGIKKNTILTKVIQDLDAFICNIREEVIKYLTLVNIGTGAKVYKGINGIGNKEIRTILSGNTDLISIVEREKTIDISAGVPLLDLNNDLLSLIVTTSSGSNFFGQVDLSNYNYNTFVQSASFNETTLDITITRNNSEGDIVIPLDFLRNHINSGSYSENVITLTLLDGATVTVELAQLVSEILTAAADAQVQSDYLESSPSSKAYITNRNPSKTVVLGASGVYNISDEDNNYIIEIDNGANEVTINASTVTLGSSFFVGFIQKGTASVTIVGADIVPEFLTNVIFGQGHICAIEAINNTKYLIGTLKFA